MNQSLVTWIQPRRIVGIPTPLDRRGDATKFPGYSDILIVWLGKQCICVDIAPRMDLLAISIIINVHGICTTLNNFINILLKLHLPFNLHTFLQRI